MLVTNEETLFISRFASFRVKPDRERVSASFPGAIAVRQISKEKLRRTQWIEGGRKAAAETNEEPLS